MTAKLAPRHRGSEKAFTPITGTFGGLGKRSVAVASATGVALTAIVASTAAATAPTVLPQAPSGDFVSNLESTDTATLVSLNMDWDSGDTVSVNNYGMPRIGGGGSRGRLVVQLRVVVPTNLSNKQRELLRAFADEMGDDVASGKKSVTDRIKSALDDILD